MKRVFILMFSLCSFITQAQSYKPIITDSITKWSIVVLPDYHASQEWIISGDTVFNNKTYKIATWFISPSLYANNSKADSLWRVNPPEYLTGIHRFVRETEDASKLFVYDEYTKNEYLSSDLNLQKGDTFYLPLNSYYYLYRQSDMNYSIVDSIYIKDGLKHVRLNSILDYYQEKLTFIEQIGPNLGIFYMYGGELVNNNVFCLNCFHNKQIFYKQTFKEPNPWNYPCSFNWNFNSLPTKYLEKYKLIQTKEKISIQFDSFVYRNIDLYDITGRKLISINSQSQNYEIYTNNLESGCYVIQILNRNLEIRMTNKIMFTK